jgi:hypothetical protein
LWLRWIAFTRAERQIMLAPGDGQLKTCAFSACSEHFDTYAVAASRQSLQSGNLRSVHPGQYGLRTPLQVRRIAARSVTPRTGHDRRQPGRLFC